MMLGGCSVVGSALNETAAFATRASYSDDAHVLVEGPISLSTSSLRCGWLGRTEADSGADLGTDFEVVASFDDSASNGVLGGPLPGMLEGALGIGDGLTEPEKVLGGLLDEVR